MEIIKQDANAKDGSTVIQIGTANFQFSIKEMLPIIKKIEIKSRDIEEKGTFPIIYLPRAENPYFTGRTDILDLIYYNFKNGDNVAKVQLLRGLGGVGKSSIALQYAYNHQEEYDFVWWVNAESSDSVLFSYKKFLLELKIISEDDEATVIIRAMELWFMRNKKWLFIFDNVDAMDIGGGWLEKYLPKKRNGHMLVTTRSWDSYIGKVINIDVFTETEAVTFLKIRTDKTGEGYSDDSAQELVKLVQYLPLALEQAAAYIRETPRVIYRDYINLYIQYGIEIFNADNQLIGYNSTITVTWKISMEKITNKSSVQMFNMCAYLAPDAIPVEMFIRGSIILPKTLKNGINNHLQRDSLLSDLVRYSLLGCERDENIPGDEKGMLYMHRLLQEVVQKNIGSETKWLEYGLQLLSKIADWDEDDKISMCSFNIESPHANTIAEKSYVVFKDDSTKLIDDVSHIFFATGRINRILLYLELALSQFTKCIEILERFCNDNNQEENKNRLLMAYINRGQIYNNMIIYDKAIEDFNKSIAIGKQLRIENMFILENQLALAYMDRGISYFYKKLYDRALLDNNKSIEIYEYLNKSDSSSDENELALAYINRGVTYESISKYNEALSDYNKGIAIWEKIKNEGKAVNESELAKAYMNRSTTNAKVVVEKNKERLSNDGKVIYNRNLNKKKE